ncbi:hypothetical protein BJ912DRAFT_1148480 [Pholiota molesta]|nr:hypothetical protein BJ912DRAFT_1148480 [Pholiota molesta]
MPKLPAAGTGPLPKSVTEAEIRPRNTAVPRCPSLACSALGPLSQRFNTKLIVPELITVDISRQHYGSSLYRLSTRASKSLSPSSPTNIYNRLYYYYHRTQRYLERRRTCIPPLAALLAPIPCGLGLGGRRAADLHHFRPILAGRALSTNTLGTNGAWACVRAVRRSTEFSPAGRTSTTPSEDGTGVGRDSSQRRGSSSYDLFG